MDASIYVNPASGTRSDAHLGYTTAPGAPRSIGGWPSSPVKVCQFFANEVGPGKAKAPASLVNKGSRGLATWRGYYEFPTCHTRERIFEEPDSPRHRLSLRISTHSVCAPRAGVAEQLVREHYPEYLRLLSRGRYLPPKLNEESTEAQERRHADCAGLLKLLDDGD